MIAEQLKKAVLQAAIQGKLTEQLPEDGDARDLLKEIQKEKARLTKEGKLKKENPLPEITEDEIPFDIPENWVWVRLGDIVSVKGGKRIPVGKTLTRNNTGHKYIRVADMQEGTIIANDIHYVPLDVLSMIRNYTISSSDVYITVAGSIGRVGTVPGEFDAANLTENADKLVFKLNDKNWLVCTLQSSFIQSQIAEFTTKVGQPKLAIMRIENLVIPLASKEEQIRIANVIDSILAEIDKLARDENKLNDLEQAFPKKMKDAILQYAIQGKLTEQLPEDGNARDLLKDIHKEKARLIKEGKLKKETPLPEITENEIPFDIPNNWVWARLGDLTELNPRNKIDDDTPVSFIPMTLIDDGYTNTFNSDKRYWKEVKSGFTHFADNDVIVAKITPCFQNRKSAVVRNLINGYGAGTTELHVVRPLSSSIISDYILYIVKTEYFIGDGVLSMTGTAGQQRVGKTYFENLLFPLPPTKEQQRIVEKLDQVLPLLDRLE